MAYTLTIKDETFPGKVLHQMELALQNELVTVEDIIEARVNKEVEEYNKKLPQYYNGLVQPTDSEAMLNGYKLKERKKIDPEKQVYVALDAFLNNGYFVLVDNKQSESLDEEVLLNGSTTVSFLKLTPLVGG
ncbi:hypothetical protein [Rufibacter roseus]|uniref:Uncharacterized protein n=1 Tax=Rufibacter roseus TaxID=1567108 RepID=A0ABW2DL72_9BACT|nr:hypothetical protein [Rufibacter roseus]